MEEAILKYGETTCAIPLEGAASVTWLKGPEMPEIRNLEEAFLKAVTTDAIDSPPLMKWCARGIRSPSSSAI